MSATVRQPGFHRGRAREKTVRLPPPRGETLPAFAAALNAVITCELIDLLPPTCEEVFFVSRVRERLPEACNVFTAPFELLRELHSKWTFVSGRNSRRRVAACFAGLWVVQAFKQGTEICSYSVAVNGRLCVHIAYRPGYRLAGSSSYYFECPRIFRAT